MRMLFLVASVLLSATVAHAAQNTGGGGTGGAGFTCNEPENPGRCSCMGPIDSADCKGMKKNCDGPITCGPLVDNCLCKYSAVKVNPVGKINKVPTGGLMKQGN